MRHVRVLVWSIVLVGLVGCSEEILTTGTVTGTVTIGGKAAENIAIEFVPTDSTVQVASGRTDAEGLYTLFSGVQGTPGAVPGKYKIVLTDGNEGDDEGYMGGGESEAGGANDGTSREPSSGAGRVPKEYTMMDTTPKEVNVVLGDNTFDIEL